MKLGKLESQFSLRRIEEDGKKRIEIENSKQLDKYMM